MQYFVGKVVVCTTMQIAAHWDQLDVGNLVKNMAQVNRQIWKINKGTNKNMGGGRNLKRQNVGHFFEKMATMMTMTTIDMIETMMMTSSVAGGRQGFLTMNFDGGTPSCFKTVLKSIFLQSRFL